MYQRRIMAKNHEFEVKRELLQRKELVKKMILEQILEVKKNNSI